MNIVLAQSTISKTLCIEKVELPNALFNFVNQTQPDVLITCSGQAINFINLSSATGDSSIEKYLWDFGDGTFSTAYEPTKTYEAEGEYTVSLTVTNSCNCNAVYTSKVIAERKGFEIQCPTVVCEGQSAIYSLPFDGTSVCNNNYNWSVTGGHIIAQGNGRVEVLWDDIDDLGFGYVTFNPQNCNVPCLQATTVKVPVIQKAGVIQGPTNLCLKEQGTFKLPQWPTTDIHWAIEGNVDNSLADVILTDQRNEVIIQPHATGLLTLRAIYTNTLLNCSGTAVFRFFVRETLNILGDNVVCQKTESIFTNSLGNNVTWVLTDHTNAIIDSTLSTIYSYNFEEAGVYNLRIQSTDFCEVDPKVIVVVPAPELPSPIVGENIVCPNTPYLYSIDNPDPNYTYHWIVNNGQMIGAAEGTEVNISFTGLFPASIEVVSKLLTNPYCESEPRILTVTKQQVLAEIYSDNYGSCSSTDAKYEVRITGTADLYSEGDSYMWSVSNPTVGSVIEGQGTNIAKILWNDVTQVTTVNVIATIGKCTLTPTPQIIRQVTIYPKPKIKIQADVNPVCSGDLYTVTYTVSSDNGVPFSGNEVIIWNFGGNDVIGTAGSLTQSKSYNNNGTTSIQATVTAYIANANGCGATNTAAFTSTILPNPPALASITFGGNVYCEPSDVNTTITVSSNTTNVSFQWYRDGVAIPGATGTSLTVNSILNFGSYTFTATNPINSCLKKSNTINIIKNCGPPPLCTIIGQVQNNSFVSACGEITLQGNAVPTPIST